ncbi:MAG: HAD family hydrolase [Alphaproteobacteria bacterium]
MTYSLILFDCDGTLVDSEYLNIKAIIALLEEFGITNYDIPYGLSHFSGHRFSNIIAMIAKETGFTFPDDAAKQYLAKVRALAPTEMSAVEGAKSVVQAAANMAEICVVSNGERNNVLWSLDFVDLRTFFEDDYIFTGLMAAPKPAPDLFLLAAERKNTPSAQTLIIEDSITGVTAAVAAGMDVWGFCGTHHAPDDHADNLKKAGATAVYHSMSDIKEALDTLASPK